MIFPAINFHLWGIFHGYVSHNQMVLQTSSEYPTAFWSRHHIHRPFPSRGQAGPCRVGPPIWEMKVMRVILHIKLWGSLQKHQKLVMFVMYHHASPRDLWGEVPPCDTMYHEDAHHKSNQSGCSNSPSYQSMSEEPTIVDALEAAEFNDFSFYATSFDVETLIADWRLPQSTQDWLQRYRKRLEVIFHFEPWQCHGQKCYCRCYWSISM